MKIEVLYPEICYLYGDLMNIEYLHRCIPEAEIIRTSMKTPPAFLHGDIDMICLCSMTEHAQELVIDALLPYKERIEALIDGGTVFLATGNALEIFIKDIQNEDGTKIEALGLFDLTAKRRMMDRYNSLWLGKFGDIDMVGLKSQFTHAYNGVSDGSSNDTDGLFETVRGAGRNPDVKPEGIRKNNFMATYVLGPLLIMNPLFTKYIMSLLGAGDRPLAYEEAAMDSYNLRLKEYSDPKRGFDY
jgi:CobQ-like glutamine amidotransferase family enzyme